MLMVPHGRFDTALVSLQRDPARTRAWDESPADASWTRRSASQSPAANNVDDVSLGMELTKLEASLQVQASHLERLGAEPTSADIAEYLEKHQLQPFLTDVIMHVARHFPPDPFAFILDHIEAMVKTFRRSRRSPHGVRGAGGGCRPYTAPAAMGGTAAIQEDATKESAVLAAAPQAAEASGTALQSSRTPTPAQQGAVAHYVATALQTSELTRLSGVRLFDQFAGRGGEDMTEEGFEGFCKHFEATLGLSAADSRSMLNALKRWRFRANAAEGTHGLPLWPLSRESFLSAFPSLLRTLRDRYVPISSKISRSLFIRQASGELSDKYDIGNILGTGTYGEVLLVTSKATKERRVVKLVARERHKSPSEGLSGEIDLLRTLDHPHITRIFEYFQTEFYTEIVMEPALGGTLSHLSRAVHYDQNDQRVMDLPETLTESWVAAVFTQLLSALTYAHTVVGVVHKDLKGDNVLLVARPGLTVVQLLQEPVHAMLTDFGLAEVFAPQNPALGEVDGSGASPATSIMEEARRSTRVGGTPAYMSPEMFKGSFAEKSDIWSLGVVMFDLMCGELPYQGAHLMIYVQHVCSPRKHPRWELLRRYRWSAGARWFCQQLLIKDEAERPSASQALQNDWLVKAKTVLDARFGLNDDSDGKDAMYRLQLQSHTMRMAMHCITSQLGVSQLGQLCQRFENYDSTGDGKLSSSEARQLLEDLGVTDNDAAELILASLDCDSSGFVEYSEFIAGSLSLAGENVRNHLRSAFDIFDLDGTGDISLDELRHVLTAGPNADLPAWRARSSSSMCPAAHILPDGKTVDAVMRDLDTNGTGRIEYTEFVQYLYAEYERTNKLLCVDSVGSNAVVAAGG
mmetsp:Transcript_20323/g.56492  ORF Transcript_20323/g.56492 Transcript_20323/m.56492 type:complete len:858 (-) Transcript_20323:329-2902(-)